VNEKILNAIKELREKSTKRNFSQTFDLIVSLKEIDLKKPENKFSEDIVLPHGRGQEAEVVVFSDSLKDLDCKVLTSEDLNKVAKNKRSAKKLSGTTNFFLSEAKMMPLIGKILGAYLGPRDRMPKLIAGENIKSMVKNYKNTVRIRVKDTPVIQCLVGKQDMKDEEIAENVEAVIKSLELRLPKGKRNIRRLLLKFTMGEPVKIEV
jgi:large subunit ribosomal protein L1